MRLFRKRLHRPQISAGATILGAERLPFFRDLYRVFLEASWSAALAGIVVAFVAINVVYGSIYFVAGGIANARDGSFFDTFVFSVQTLATIGYGAMAPSTTTAHLVVVSEAIVGLLVTALSTGLVFAKFSRSPAMVVFTKVAVISPMNGVPTLHIRVGNERGTQLAEAQARLLMIRTEVTAEGVTWYRMIDLPLQRDRSPVMGRSWSVLHVIDEASPLCGYTPERMASEEIELVISIEGVDDSTAQTVHARHRYEDKDVVFGARHKDMVSIDADGKVVLDVRGFHETVPTLPTPTFPYPRQVA
jgi:inward rectifier potassium channel